MRRVRAPSESLRPATETRRAVDELAVVDDADEFVARDAATIFSRVNAPPPPLISCSCGVHFVGAVDVHEHFGRGVQVEHGECRGRAAARRRFGTRDGRIEMTAQWRQRVDECVRRRAGADADDAVIAQARFDQRDRRFGGGALECICVSSLRRVRRGRHSGSPFSMTRLRRPALPMLEQYVKKILASRVYDVAIETPLHEARSLSRRLGNRVFLKREDLQPCSRSSCAEHTTRWRSSRRRIARAA